MRKFKTVSPSPEGDGDDRCMHGSVFECAGNHMKYKTVSNAIIIFLTKYI